MEQAQIAVKTLSQPLVPNHLSDTLSDGQSLEMSCGALLEQFGSLSKIGDEIAKVCSSVSSVLDDRKNLSFFLNRSILMSISRGQCSPQELILLCRSFASLHPFNQMVQAQQDGNILDLIKAMEKTHSVAMSADELKKYPALQDIIVQMLKKTIDCS